MLGNTHLVNYGIFDESPDTIRIHVGIDTGLVFVFKSGDAQEHLRRITYAEKPVYTDGIVTAKGATPAWDNIPNIKSYEIPSDLLARCRQHKFLNPSEKSRVAVEIVKMMLANRQIPIDILITEIDNRADQIKGIDIVVNTNLILQVKMGWTAGPRERGGRGNLFLQTQECNPYRYH